MVFMDTTTTIVTGSACERWKYAAFIISTFLLGAFTYPLFANWAWGGGWLANLGHQFRARQGLLRFCWLGGSALGRRNHRISRRNDARAADRQV